jgi:hypothetical protein
MSSEVRGNRGLACGVLWGDERIDDDDIAMDFDRFNPGGFAASSM